MRSRLLEASIFLLVISVASATIWWRYSLFPAPSAEVVKLDAQKRDLLMRLRREQKFEANDYPPLGYNGPASVADGAAARAAVNDVLDTILARRNGPVSAIEVSNLIDHAMTRVDGLETEDRDRTSGY